MTSDNNRHEHTETIAHPHVPEAIGWFGVGMCVVTGATDLILGFFLEPDYSPIADTISDLAAGGRYEHIQDLAIQGFAFAMLLTSVGLLIVRRGGKRWNLGAGCMALSAVLIFFIAYWDEYGDHDTGGWVLHFELVYSMALLVPIGMLLLRSELAKRAHHARYYRVGYIAMPVLWIALAPFFYFADTAVDGAIERVIAAILLLWVGSCAWSLATERTLNEKARRD